MARRHIVVIFAAMASGCSLFVSLDGLTSSDAFDGSTSSANSDGGALDGPSNGDGGVQPNDGAAGSTYVAAILADSPVGYWRLNETSGPTVRDEIGNAHPGTIYGGVQLGVEGVDGTAANFDGNKSCIDVGPNFLFGAPASFSVEVWVKPVDFASYRIPVSTESDIPSGLRDGWTIAIATTGQADIEGWNSETDANNFIFGAYSQNTPGGAPPLVAGAWTQIDTTYDGSDGTVEIWFDGVLRSQSIATGSLRGDRGTLSFGCRAATAPFPISAFNGALDEISIFDKVLTKPQILAHKAARLSN